VGSQGTLPVDAGPDISSEPGAVIYLRATGSEGESLVYQWVITDKEGTQLAEGTGAEFSWTPSQEGLYTAVVGVSGLETPFEIAIPVTDPSMITPMYHDESAGVWITQGISNVNVADESIATFKVNHLTYFALMGESVPSEGEEDRVDKTMKDAAGCFIDTAASGSVTAPQVQLPPSVWVSWRTLKLVSLHGLCFILVLLALISTTTVFSVRKL